MRIISQQKENTNRAGFCFKKLFNDYLRKLFWAYLSCEIPKNYLKDHLGPTSGLLKLWD